MSLSLETRDVGRVTVIRCKGRLVAGSGSETLRTHIAWVLRDRRNIVLDLGELAFVDSSGLGAMVRTLSSTRQAHGDLKLCQIPEHVQKVLELSHLSKLFDAHDSEDNAIAAFYRAPLANAKPACSGRCVLCIHPNADVLNYLREILLRAGYEVHTSSNLRDALILMRVSRFDLLILGAELTSSPATQKAFRDASAILPVIELESDFSTVEAGTATSFLLDKIANSLHSASQA
ncbi:MAG TPA: anti-sigma factor antagonist [Candidatus Sulfotelmatobacter sp.]|nr:anti-sigma factor antagonist [Candidatus Sulfotelmatobacter sp.]